MKKELHIVSHSHWDREWYMPFEAHRARLIDLIDEVIETLDRDPDFKCFHMDGHVLLIQDYLEIRPEMRERLTSYIRAGRIKIGPWYVLQDEYLISGEGNVRNMLIGLREARQYGGAQKIGYFPDSFGNIAQMPQILRGFGIDFAYVGRGQETIRFTNESGADGPRSEMVWVSPDGSEAACVIFSHWYHNAMEIPSGRAEAAKRLRGIIEAAESTATTPFLLGMNGCDHQPLQTDIAAVLKNAQPDFPEYTFVHSNLSDYADKIRPYKDRFKRVEGELASQNTDGFGALINTASARVYAKQANHRAYTLLERQAEPFSVLNALAGRPYRFGLLRYAWKLLLSNYPHDTICGCSCDEVLRESMTRFEKCTVVANEEAGRSAREIAARIDFSALAESDRAVTVFNPAGFAQDGFVTAFIDYPKDGEAAADRISLYGTDGNEIPCDVKDLGIRFKYWLPEHTFRECEYVRRFEVAFAAKDLPCLGYNSFVARLCAPGAKSGLKLHENGAENEFLSFEIAADGSVALTDKQTGAAAAGLNVFENTGDAGDEYIYAAPARNVTARTKDVPAEVELFERGKARVVYRVTHRIPVPYDGKNGEAADHTLVIRSFVTLWDRSRRLEFKTEIENDCVNHRVRALFYNEIKTDFVRVDSHFELLDRPVTPLPAWKNPDHSQRQLAFIELFDESKALLVANRGLMEYEVLRDGRNTMALTLLRGVGEIGDWGVFPTPEAQCSGTQTAEYAVSLGRDGFPLYREGWAFYYGESRAVSMSRQSGTAAPKDSVAELVSGDVVISAIKKAEDNEMFVLRLYNPLNEAQAVRVRFNPSVSRACLSNLNEEPGEELPLSGHTAAFEAGPKKIVTLLFS